MILLVYLLPIFVESKENALSYLNLFWQGFMFLRHTLHKKTWNQI